MTCSILVIKVLVPQLLNISNNKSEKQTTVKYAEHIHAPQGEASTGFQWPNDPSKYRSQGKLDISHS